MNEIKEKILDRIEEKISEKNLNRAWAEIQVLEGNGEFVEKL